MFSTLDEVLRSGIQRKKYLLALEQINERAKQAQKSTNEIIKLMKEIYHTKGKFTGAESSLLNILKFRPQEEIDQYLADKPDLKDKFEKTIFNLQKYKIGDKYYFTTITELYKALAPLTERKITPDTLKNEINALIDKKYKDIKYIFPSPITFKDEGNIIVIDKHLSNLVDFIQKSPKTLITKEEFDKFKDVYNNYKKTIETKTNFLNQKIKTFKDALKSISKF